MKNILLLGIVVSLLLACSKDVPQQTAAVKWGTVGDKVYTDSFPFVTGQYRRYWVYWSPDTVCPPLNQSCYVHLLKRVTRACFDTIFVNRYPERLPDSVFIPAYPY